MFKQALRNNPTMTFPSIGRDRGKGPRGTKTVDKRTKSDKNLWITGRPATRGNSFKRREYVLYDGKDGSPNGIVSNFRKGPNLRPKSAYDSTAFPPLPQSSNLGGMSAPLKGISLRVIAPPYPLLAYASGDMATNIPNPFVIQEFD